MVTLAKAGRIILIIIFAVSLAYPGHYVSGSRACPPKVELPNPVLFATTPYVANGSLAFNVDVYYFYQFFEGMCPISYETDELQCLDSEGFDFAVHYAFQNGKMTGKLGNITGVPLKTYPLRLKNGSVKLNGSRVSFPFSTLERYLSVLNISGTFTQKCIYSPDLKPLLARFKGMEDVVSKMRGFIYNGTIYVYFPRAELLNCAEFIPERFHVAENYVSPIIPLKMNGSAPMAPPLVLAYKNGSMKPLLEPVIELRRGENCEYYSCSLPNLRLPRPVKPPVTPTGGRNYTYVYVNPERVSLTVNGSTNGTFALLLVNLTAKGTLIPGGPNVPAEIHYTLLFSYNDGLSQVNLSSILSVLNPPREDDYGNPAFYFGGADDEIFNIEAAFVNGTPYIGVRVNGSDRVTLIRLMPEKEEWEVVGSVSSGRWEKMVQGSSHGVMLQNASKYSRYFPSTPSMAYVSVNGGKLIYPKRYDVVFYGLPSGYARIGEKILPTCSLWPVYVFSDNGTVYGLFRVGENFTVYPELVEYRETSNETTASPAVSKTETRSKTPPKETHEEERSICGPGMVVLLALLAIRGR